VTRFSSFKGDTPDGFIDHPPDLHPGGSGSPASRAQASLTDMRLPQIRNALFVGALALSGCTINFVRNPKEPQVLHERIEYFKWLYEKGFYRFEPELMKRAATRMFDERGASEDREREVSARVEQLLFRLEQAVEQELKQGQKPAPSEPPRP
jgi:hypothetical protein